MLHVTQQELASGTSDELFTGKRRRGMDQCHGVLQLIAEPVGAAGLIIAAPTPQAA